MKQVLLRELGVLPDTGKDCTEALRGALEQIPNGCYLIMEPGEYHFYADKAFREAYALSNSDWLDKRCVSVLLRNRQNLCLDGRGARWIFHGKTMPLVLDKCQRVTVKNISIDWEIPLTAEGTIQRAENDFVDVTIDAEKYPFHVTGRRLFFDGEGWQEPVWDHSNTEFDVHTGKVAAGRGETFPATSEVLLPDGTIRFWGDFTGREPETGNVLVLRHGKREHAGILLWESEEIQLEKISLFGSGGLGVLAQFSRDLSFLQMTIGPNRKAGRLFAGGHDDGIHLAAVSGTVRVEQCSFFGLMDDPINLHGIAAKVETQTDSCTLQGRFMHPQAKGFEHWTLPGHTIAFLDGQDMHEVFQARVEEFRLNSRETFTLRFDRPIPAPGKNGLSLEDLDRTAALICRNNHFGSCRARGLLFCTPRPVLVENNLFESAGAAIRIPGDASTWYESGRCQDVTIRQNFFADCCLTSEYQGGEGIISISPELPSPCVNRPCHRNIRIEENTFLTSDARVLYARCTDGLQFSQNRILRSYAYPSGCQKHKIVTTEYCCNVTVRNNQLVGDVVGQYQECGICDVEK